MTNNPLRRYIDAKAEPGSSWALVTGSTGGIGLEWARQLSHLGFSILLHGRNGEKLQKVRTEIEASLPETLRGKVTIKPVIADAATVTSNGLGEISTHLSAGSELNLKVVVNNLGVVHDAYPLLENVEEGEIMSMIASNISFSTLVAAKALPLLKKNQPSLMINTSSLAAYAPGPYLSIYNGSKAYNLQFSRSLYQEMISENNTQVDIVAMLPGTVISGMNEGPPSSFLPLASTWVASALQSLAPSWSILGGASRPPPVIIPHGPHARGAKMLNMLPASVGDKLTRNFVRDAKDKKEKDRA